MEGRLMADDQEVARRLGELTGEVRAMEKSLNQLQRDVADVKAQANRWKGGFAAILFVGGILGWTADKLWAVMHRIP
jgi:ABC-type Fe2+-enterobactin transport system substrate-binding protein